MKKKIAVFLVLIVVFLQLPISSFAAESYNITFGVEFGQPEARTQLDMINNLRKNDAWYYNEDNTKYVPENLSPLSYDYLLEEYAMQRAAEIAVYYSHERPDGTSRGIDDFPSSYTSRGENIAYGYDTSAEVFDAWCETNEDYDGQGHRRNILGSFECVAVGHAIVDGTHFWVQEFGSPKSDRAYTEPVDGDQTVAVSFAPSIVGYYSVHADQTPIRIAVGDTAEIPVLSSMQIDNAGDTINLYNLTIESADTVPSISDETIAKIEDGKIVGLTPGETSVNIAAFNRADYVKIIVSDSITYGQCGDNAYYTLNNKTGELVISGSGKIWDTMQTDNFSYEYCGYFNDGERIVDRGFSYYSDYITSVVISEGITEIGDDVFHLCGNIVSVELPESLETIGYRAFKGCRELKSVDLPDHMGIIKEYAFQESGIEYIDFYGRCFNLDPHAFDDTPFYDAYTYTEYGCTYLDKYLIHVDFNYDGEYRIKDGTVGLCDHAFGSYANEYLEDVYCENLKKIEIPDSVLYIGDYAFHGCINLKELVFGSGVRSIGYDAFGMCSSLEEVSLPKDLESLGDNVFVDCGALTTVKDWPRRVGRIPKNTFSNCNALKEFVIPDSVTTIESGAFWFCKSLESVEIPDSVTEIGEMAFGQCENISSISLGKNVRAIGYEAFDGTSAEKIYIPAKVEEIGFAAFYGNKLSAFDVDRQNKYFASDKYGVLFDKNLTKLLQYPAGNTQKEYTVPESVKTIGKEAFSSCSALEKINLCDGLETIEENAFYFCFIREMFLPESVNSISDTAFLFCKGLSRFIVDERNENFSSDESGVLFNKDKTELIVYPYMKYSYTYSVPSSARKVSPGFFEAQDLIYIDASCVKNTNVYCLDCPDLRYIKIADDLTEWDDNQTYHIYKDCESLEAIIIDGELSKQTYSMLYSPYVKIYADTCFDGYEEYKAAGFDTFVQKCESCAFELTEEVLFCESERDGYRIYKCVNCGCPKVEAVAPIGHSFVEVSGTEFCDAEGEVVYRCENCGNYDTKPVPATGHDWSKWTELDEYSHQRVSKKDPTHVETAEHTWNKGKVTTKATCERDGVKTYTCTVCKATRQETIPATGHAFGEWKELNENEHQRICANDANHVETAAHTWNKGKVTTAATCETDGVKTYTCTACKATKTEKIPATGHAFGAWTELDENEHQRVCANDANHVETAAHTWNKGKITTKATCETEGVKTYTCTVCKATKTEVIPATGHAFGAWTELDGEKHQRVCSNDPSHIETAAHNWNNGKVTKEPAPGVEGEMQFECKDCGTVKSEPVEALPVETEAPTTEVPTTESPTTEAPTTEAPTTEAPTTVAPTTEAPTTEAPTTEAPTTEAPTTETPTTEAPTTTEPTQYYTLGDVNMDGKINSADARLALRAAAKVETLTETQTLLADVSDDGKVKAADARTILRIAAKLEPKPEKQIPAAA